MILVTGAGGMLGTDLVHLLRAGGKAVVACGRTDLDIADPQAVGRMAAGVFGSPEWIVNCAAYTAVDRAETEVQAAFELNAIAPGYLANAAAALGAKLIHISTDFVFDGEASEPYKEDALTHPLGVYGTSKRDGEEAVLSNNPHALVVRTSWLFGAYGNSFPKSILRAYLAGKALRVVSDQVGCPTYTGELSRFLLHLIETNAFPGMYHGVGPEAMTWHELAVQAIEAYQGSCGESKQAKVEAIATKEWSTPAKRPKFSVLANTKLPFQMAPLTQSLADFVAKADPSV